METRDTPGEVPLLLGGPEPGPRGSTSPKEMIFISARTWWQGTAAPGRRQARGRPREAWGQCVEGFFPGKENPMSSGSGTWLNHSGLVE